MKIAVGEAYRNQRSLGSWMDSVSAICGSRVMTLLLSGKMLYGGSLVENLLGQCHDDDDDELATYVRRIKMSHHREVNPAAIKVCYQVRMSSRL